MEKLQRAQDQQRAMQEFFAGKDPRLAALAAFAPDAATDIYTKTEFPTPSEMQAPVAVMGPNGPMYVTREQALGMRPYDRPPISLTNIPAPPSGYFYKDPTNPSAGLSAIEGGPAEKPTEGQTMTAGYADRMIDASRQISELTSSGFNPAAIAEAGPAAISNFLASPNYQTYRAAQEDWVRAKLRKESGAVIGEEEMDREISTYFPKMGDSKKVIDRKEKQRKTAEQAMSRAAGSQYYRKYKEVESNDSVDNLLNKYGIQ